MMRSLYSGVSGLNNHQTRMDVIGNNVSNVNTHGFKKGRVTFQDLISQRLSGASRPTEERGGINPKQVGLGMQIATIDNLHIQGSLRTTAVNTDLAVMGSGFFIQRDGEQTVYTRAGAFNLDRDGTLVNPANGFRVQGYTAVRELNGNSFIDTSTSVDDIIIPIGEKDPAQATSLIRYKSNLNKLTPLLLAGATEAETARATWTSTIKAIDSRGDEQEVQLNFVKSLDATGAEIPNEWRVTVNVFDSLGNPLPGVVAQTEAGDATNDFLVRFNTAGALSQIVNPNDNNALGAPGENLAVTLTYTNPGSDPQNITLDLGTAGNYDGLTQFSSPSSTRAYFQDGVKLGYLEGFVIDDAGVVTGSYTNGRRRDLGQVALALFTNPRGLDKVGETNFVETVNSGLAQVVPGDTQGAGKIRSGSLEMSNVDLAEEFTDMIVTQRGFQANSRSITTSDTMLEEVLRLKM